MATNGKTSSLFNKGSFPDLGDQEDYNAQRRVMLGVADGLTR